MSRKPIANPLLDVDGEFDPVNLINPYAYATGGGGSAPTLIASIRANSDTSGAVDTTGANLIVVLSAIYYYTPTFSDSKGNTWTQIVNAEASGSYAHKHVLYYCFNPTVGSGHTFTTNGASYGSMSVLAFSGIASSPLDLSNYATTTGESISSGSITPTQANTLVISGGSETSFNTLALTPTAGFTDAAGPDSDSRFAKAHLAYKVLTSSSSISCTWTVSTGNTDTMIASIASFKY